MRAEKKGFNIRWVVGTTVNQNGMSWESNRGREKNIIVVREKPYGERDLAKPSTNDAAHASGCVSCREEGQKAAQETTRIQEGKGDLKTASGY